MRTRQKQRVETSGDPLGVSNTTETMEQKKTTSWTPMGQEIDKGLAPANQTVSFMVGLSDSLNLDHRHAIKEDSKVVNRDWVNHQA